MYCCLDTPEVEDIYFGKFEMCVKRPCVRCIMTLEDARRSSTRICCVLKETIKAREEFKQCVLESKKSRRVEGIQKAGCCERVKKRSRLH